MAQDPYAIRKLATVQLTRCKKQARRVEGYGESPREGPIEPQHDNERKPRGGEEDLLASNRHTTIRPIFLQILPALLGREVHSCFSNGT
jgi:hypothetical protein